MHKRKLKKLRGRPAEYFTVSFWSLEPGTIPELKKKTQVIKWHSFYPQKNSTRTIIYYTPDDCTGPVVSA